MPSCAEKEKIMYIISNAGTNDKGFNIKRSKYLINFLKFMIILLILICKKYAKNDILIVTGIQWNKQEIFYKEIVKSQFSPELRTVLHSPRDSMALMLATGSRKLNSNNCCIAKTKIGKNGCTFFGFMIK